MFGANLSSDLSGYVTGSLGYLGKGAYSCASSQLLKVYRVYYHFRFYTCKFSYREADGVKDYVFMERKDPSSYGAEKTRFFQDFRRGFIFKVHTDSEETVFQRDLSLDGNAYEANCAKLRDDFFQIVGNLPINEESIKEKIFCNSDQNLYEAPVKTLVREVETIFYNVGLKAQPSPFLEDGFLPPGVNPEFVPMQEASERKLTYVVTSKENKLHFSILFKYVSFNNPSDGSCLSLKVKYVIDLNTGKAQMFYRPAQTFYLTKLVPKMIRRPVNSLFFGPKAVSN